MNINGERKFWKIFKRGKATGGSKASIFSMSQCYVELYINPANHAPWVNNGHTPGSLASIFIQ